jgi:N,N'-diacetyllegionaminate synthase
MKGIRLENREIGPGAPCFCVAEIGINHNGEVDLAKQMIEAAASAGADGVKFQNYRTEDFILDRTLTYQYRSQGREVIEAQYDLFKRCELTRMELAELKNFSDRSGIIFHSTPTSKEGIADLVALGVPLLKNGSDFLTNLPLIRAMGRTGLPTVLSTGMATLAEIDEAIQTFRETGNNQVILLHCISAYPAPSRAVNLRRIPALSTIFSCPVGFSDHTMGISAAIGAVVLGACWVEKHFTIDKSLPGPDQYLSANPAELRALIEAIRTVEKCLGDASMGLTAAEANSRRSFRLSCVALERMPAGHRLLQDQIAFHRPGIGLPPKAIDWIVGRRLRHDVERGKVLTFDDFV